MIGIDKLPALEQLILNHQEMFFWAEDEEERQLLLAILNAKRKELIEAKGAAEMGWVAIDE